MSCEVAYLPFQANANYGTWSLDFALYDLTCKFHIFDLLIKFSKKKFGKIELNGILHFRKQANKQISMDYKYSLKAFI